jgi:hypothetical protein
MRADLAGFLAKRLRTDSPCASQTDARSASAFQKCAVGREAALLSASVCRPIYVFLPRWMAFGAAMPQKISSRYSQRRLRR